MVSTRVLSRLVPFGVLSLFSAFLLFQVQPIISKFILPWFGGSPGVWTTCMLFFQLVLFAGYGYAHGLTKLPRKWQGVMHAGLLIAAALVLPIQPDDSWKPQGAEDPALRILALLVVSVGLPYFVLSSTSPLVQVWFTRALPGGKPWRLYALSNVGSLTALLSYPFFFEVRWAVDEQTTMWSWAFVAFAGVSLFCIQQDVRTDELGDGGKPAGEAVRVGWGRRLAWLLLPTLASVLLLGATNHVCQDVAVIPFLWVVPLSLYLLTFIVCFEHERWYQPLVWAVPAAGLLVTAAVYGALGWEVDYKQELGICFGAMFLGCMVCHGELVRLKPDPARLTEFYLTMSAGGALGGVLVSLVAPRVFATYTEWPLALMVGFGLASAVMLRSVWRLPYRRLRLVLLPLGAAAAVYAVLQMGALSLTPEERLVRVRNFYGALSVTEDYHAETDQYYRYLYHGGIAHGLQNLGDGYREEAVSYYGHHTGIGRALDWARGRPGARVGIVGMGAASALPYGQRGQSWRYYEINPEVVRIANDYFTYVEDFKARGGDLEVVVGDARVALEREDSQQFDVLLLDAFSGDSVPVHLLTKEAFEIYERHMKPDGIIVAHCTNRYLALASVVQKIADEMGFQTTRIGTDMDGDHEITDYLMLTRNAAFLEANPSESPFEEILLDVRPWTDRRHNLFEILEKE